MANQTLIPVQLEYFLIDIWKVKDSRIAELPLIGSGPWFLLAFIFVYLFILNKLSCLMKNRSPYFLRHYQIVYYGFMFGINGVAVPVLFALSINPANAFRCNLSTIKGNDLRGTMFIYSGLLYLLVKIFSSIDLLILYATKDHDKVTFARLMETILSPLNLYAVLKYYPGGITYFNLFLETFTNTFRYGLSTRACSDDLKPISNWEKHVHFCKCLQYLMASIHSLYTLTIQDCDCPLELRYYVLFLHSFLAIAYIFGDNFSSSSSSSSPSSSSSSSSSPSPLKSANTVRQTNGSLLLKGKNISSTKAAKVE